MYVDVETEAHWSFAPVLYRNELERRSPKRTHQGPLMIYPQRFFSGLFGPQNRRRIVDEQPFRRDRRRVVRRSFHATDCVSSEKDQRDIALIILGP